MGEKVAVSLGEPVFVKEEVWQAVPVSQVETEGEPEWLCEAKRCVGEIVVDTEEQGLAEKVGEKVAVLLGEPEFVAVMEAVELGTAEKVPATAGTAEGTDGAEGNTTSGALNVMITMKPRNVTLSSVVHCTVR